MATRDSNVLHVQEILGQAPFKMLAHGLVDAIEEAEAEGVQDPSRDPAVMLFGAFIAFHTHVDVNTVKGYFQLMDLCRTRHETEQVLQ